MEIGYYAAYKKELLLGCASYIRKSSVRLPVARKESDFPERLQATVTLLYRTL